MGGRLRIMTIGESLKRARKKLNLSLEDAAERTKIAKMFLIALENDDVSSLPQGVYTRNFLRSYAKFLQLDEDIITADYHEQYQVKPQFVTQQEQTKIDDLEFRKGRRKLFLYSCIFLLVLLGVGYYFLSIQEGTLRETLDRIWKGLQDTSGQTASPSPGQPGIVALGEGSAKPGAGESGLKKTVEEAAALHGNESDSEGASDQGEGPSMFSEVEPAAGEASDEVPALEAYEARLPSFELASLSWTPEGRSAERIEDMFALESLQPVWVEVIIDGEVLTKRLLPAGQVRCYRYGAENSVIIGDASRVAVQDGTAFKKVASAIDWTLALRNFGPGHFFKALDGKIRELQNSKD